MAVKIRLQRKGRKKAPFYHIVIADARAPRDGRFIEKIGTYNPLTIPASIELNRERAYEWLTMGAQPTETVRSILRYKGVLYQKHLMRGVRKGAMTEEQAQEMLTKFIEEKEGRIETHRASHVEKERQKLIAIDGKPKAKPEPVAEEPAEAPAEEAAEAVDTPVAEAPAEEAAAEAPVAEAPAEEPAAEEPAAEAPAEEPAEDEKKED
jgi:small subunit ribosomal protein S16